MTLAVMTRATLGHTGQPLAASPATQVDLSVRARGGAAARCRRAGGWPDLMHVAGVAWVAAFGGFVVVYGPLLIARPPAWSASG